MNYRIASRSKLIGCVFADLLIKSNLAFLRSSHEVAVTGRTQSDELRICWIVLQTAHSLLSSGIDFVNWIFTDHFECVKIAVYLPFGTHIDDSFLWAGILNQCELTNYSTSFPLTKSW
jgi:hypothetical protein